MLVLKSIGPKGGPGMPEAGLIPIPKKLARQGVKDRVRISDGRMSGTASGTIVLHVTPESYEKGPLAVVKNGDLIEIDSVKKELNLKIKKTEITKRLKKYDKSRNQKLDGVLLKYAKLVSQADEGAVTTDIN